MKKLVSALALTGLVLSTSVSAIAAPQAIDSTRVGSPISSAEELAGLGLPFLVALFAAIGALVITTTTNGDDPVLPISP